MFKGSNHQVMKIKGLKGKQTGNGLVPFTSQSDSRGHVLSPVESLKGQTLNIEHLLCECLETQPEFKHTNMKNINFTFGLTLSHFVSLTPREKGCGRQNTAPG